MYRHHSLIAPPKTHDTSRIGHHMKDLKDLAENINTVGPPCILEAGTDTCQAVQSCFPNHNRSRYKSVNVCMIRWEQDYLGVASEVTALSAVFEKQYGFNVETWEIPASEKSHNILMQRALYFLDEHDAKDNLFIIYYAGHGFINQDRQSTWAW